MTLGMIWRHFFGFCFLGSFVHSIDEYIYLTSMVHFCFLLSTGSCFLIETGSRACLILKSPLQEPMIETSSAECRDVPIMYGLYMFVKKRSFPGFFASTDHHLCVFIIPFSQTPGCFSDVCDSFTGYTLVVFVSAGDLEHYFSEFAVGLAACAT